MPIWHPVGIAISIYILWSNVELFYGNILHEDPSKFKFTANMAYFTEGDQSVRASMFYMLLVSMIKQLRLPKSRLITTLEFIHNTALSIFSGWLFLCYWSAAFKEGYPYIYRAFDSNRAAGESWYFIYLFYISKYYEWMDTVLSVCRGGNLTLLHLWHHSLMPSICWLGMIYRLHIYGPPDTINMLVHCIMYQYYALRNLGYKPWWKKHITQLQLAQFVLCALYLSPYVNDPEGYRTPRVVQNFIMFTLAIDASFAVLFAHFYYHSYITEKMPAELSESAEISTPAAAELESKSDYKEPEASTSKTSVRRIEVTGDTVDTMQTSSSMKSRKKKKKWR